MGLSAGPPKAPLVINFRSEGRSFGKGRCLVPASHFFEFTGRKYPKTKWRFTKPREEWSSFAGIWGSDEADENASSGHFALLTTSPGPDTAPYHDRQPIVVERGPSRRWTA